jgi:hypothetical protein
MGIRYYAYPITADEYPRALENPCPFHSSDPLMDAWGSVDAMPEMLYLDKCWREFQALLGPLPGTPPRPALLLVEGQVTNTNTGWIPFERALSPDQVKAIAVDLATVGEQHIRDLLFDTDDTLLSRPEEYEYIAHYLADAKEFTARLAEQDRGLVYLIG